MCVYPSKSPLSLSNSDCQTAKNEQNSYDALVKILECIGNFLKRLEIYTKVSPTPAITDMVVKIFIELLSVLDLATKEIAWGRLSMSVFDSLLAIAHGLPGHR